MTSYFIGDVTLINSVCNNKKSGMSKALVNLNIF